MPNKNYAIFEGDCENEDGSLFNIEDYINISLSKVCIYAKV